jgi:hypothetical protein
MPVRTLCGRNQLKPSQPESWTSHFDGNLGVQRGQFQSFAPTWGGQDGIPETLKERFLAFQHVFVIVDAKNYSALKFRINGLGHGSPSKRHFQYFGPGNCSKLLKLICFCNTVC